MLKKIFISTICAAIIFFMVSYFSVMISLVNRINLPVTNIGFPFRYYEQFWMGPDDLHYGWSFKYFLLDCLITWIVVTSFY